ncbi:FliG C-terminal domain-containing protein [Thermoproteota archaeon]
MAKKFGAFSIVTVMLTLCLSVIILGYSTNKISLEMSLTNQIQNAMDVMFGRANFIARVEVDLTEPKYEVRYTKQSDAELSKKKPGSEEEYLILPGYPVIKNLSPDAFRNLPFDSVTQYIEPMIRKITVHLIVNRSFSSARLGRAQAVIKDMLNMRDNRGDKIVVSRQIFYPPEITGPETIKIIPEQTLLTFENLFYLLLILTLISFTITYLILYLRSAKKSAAEKTSPGASINVNPNIQIPRGERGGGSIKLSQAPPIKQYFEFVDDGNIDKLIDIIKKESIPVKDVSTIASFLTADLSALLISNLIPEEQAEVAKNLLTQTLVERHHVDKLEAQIKNLLECLSGGESTFQHVFSYVSNKNKKELLTLLVNTDPEGYKIIRNNLILFDDIKLLNDDEIKYLLSEVRVELLATALAQVEDDTFKRIDQNLPKNARDMINQFLDLKGSMLSDEDIEQAQANVIDVLNRLEQEGKLKLREKISI